jgi:hypothetical protein
MRPESLPREVSTRAGRLAKRSVDVQQKKGDFPIRRNV